MTAELRGGGDSFSNRRQIFLNPDKARYKRRATCALMCAHLGGECSRTDFHRKAALYKHERVTGVAGGDVADRRDQRERGIKRRDCEQERQIKLFGATY